MTSNKERYVPPKLIPDPQQQSAIDHPSTPLRIVAGAGSGKTEVMAQRIVALIQRNGLHDDQVLGLTFSNKAAANLRNRIVRRLGPANRVHVATYHGFGAQLVRENAISLGLPSYPRLLDRARAFQLLLDEFHRVDLPSRKLGRPENIIDEALTLASSCADHLVCVETIRADCDAIIADERSSKTLQRSARSRRDLCILLDAYASAKQRLGYIDYGDQISLAVQVLRTSPEVGDDLYRRYRAVLLDEFQDTNVAQRELLKLVWVDKAPPGHAPITVVGDDLQAIYGFRGAHVHNLTHFDEYVPGTTSIALETNYRSGESIVALANHIQASLPDALPKILRAHTFNPSGKVTSFVAADDRDEALTIAAQIASTGAPWKEIAVLCRKRRLIAPIAEALHEANVPVEIVGIGGLLTRPEIVDTVAWLQVLGLPEVGTIDRRHRLAGIDPNVAILRLLQGPRFRLGLRDLAALSRADRQRRRVTTADLSADANNERVAPPVDPGLDLRRVVLRGELPEVSVEAWRRVLALRSTIDRLTLVLARHTFVHLVEAVIAEADLLAAVDERGHENLLRFLHLAQTFAPLDGPITIGAFLEYLELVVLSEDEPAEATGMATDAVQIMTIHQAKGLEFNTVFVPGLSGAGSSRIFPDYRSTANAVTVGAALPHWLRIDHDGFPAAPHSRGEEERLRAHVTLQQEHEERRLLYVALTRARQRLVVSAAHWYGGPQKPQGPSEFYALVTERPDVVHEVGFAAAAVENPQLAARRRQHETIRNVGPHSKTGPAGQSERPPTRRRRAAALPSPSLFDVRSVPAPMTPVPLGPSVDATALVTYAQCPQRFEWSHVVPLPQRSRPAARVGTGVHQWIEEQAGTNLPFGVDIAFALTLPGETVIHGSIDAAYERDDCVEIIDFNAGHRPSEGDRSVDVELGMYALVAADLWNIPPDRLRTSSCHPSPDGEPGVDIVSTNWSASLIDEFRSLVSDMLGAIRAGHFSPHGGAWCRECDFASFCSGART